MVTAQKPISRIENSCPTGTYSSGNYCKLFKSSSGNEQTIIEKFGSDCLTGCNPPRDYCKQYSSESAREATPPRRGRLRRVLVQIGAILCEGWWVRFPMVEMRKILSESWS